MKKDKEWAKDEVVRGSNGYPTFLDKRDGNLKKMVDIYFVRELIDKIEEPEITEDEAWNKIAESFPVTMQEIKEGVTKFVSNTSINLSEWEKISEPKLPVVPQFVADWIDKCRTLNWGIEDVFTPESLNSLFATQTEGWLNEDKSRYEILARAWLDGYEVEKEKLYYVLDKEGCVMLRRYGNGGVCKMKVANTMKPEAFWGEVESIKLSESEIKDYDERYWDFAEPVTD